MILAVALVLRLFVLFTEGNRIFLGTDDENYRDSAVFLLNKGFLTYAGWKEPTVFIMPGYPVLLAAIFAATGSVSWLAVRLFQVVVSVMATWFTIRLGTRFGSRSVGYAAGAVSAVYPPNLTTPCFLMTEAVFSCLLLLAIYCFMRSEEENGRFGWLPVTGLVIGISTYFRPTSGLLPAVFGVYLLLRGHPWKKTVVNSLLIGLVALICLSPWITRNYLIYGEFIPFTVSGGNPFLRGTYIDDKITERFPWIEGERILSDKAQMEYGKVRFMEGFRSDFQAYLYWYTVGKFTNYWWGAYYYRPLTYLPVRWVNLFHRVILLTGAAGMVWGMMRRQPVALLCFLVCGYFSALHLLYLTGPRYSYPLIQFVIIMAAYLAAQTKQAMGNLKTKPQRV